jgi:hypothetical protein
VGWASLTAGCPMAAQALFEIRTGTILVAQAAVESSGPQRNADLFFDQTSGTGTGIAVANLSSTLPVRVYVSEFDENGVPSGGATLTLGPRRQAARFVSELLGGQARQGSLRLEATGPIVVTTLQQTGVVLATLPVVPRILRAQ